jgi:YHS domain-containing protein
MKKTLVALLILAGLGLIFAAGSFVGWRSATTPGTASAARQVLSYTCPMHPAYHSDRPGDCPSCGMRLEPVFADPSGTPLAGGSGTVSTPPGALQIDSQKQQAIGVRVEEVKRSEGTWSFRTTGRVAPDEARLYRLNASTDFWIREVFAPTTGSIVRKNDPLLSFYSAGFLSAGASYMYALDTVDRLKATKDPGADQANVVNTRLRQAVDALRTLGVSDFQIDEMARTREVSDLVTVRAPVNGLVLSRNATLGQYIQPGTEIYQFVDLSRVWVLADVFENERPFVRPGMSADLVLVNSTRRLRARVSDVPPQFDEKTRALQVRIETDNPGGALRPGMFVDVEFQAELPPAITVPAEAVVNTGLRRTVFVDRGDGYLDARRVETGWRAGDRVQILKGLMEGEKIVVSGTFLIDSESRMRAAAHGINPNAAERDLLCGMDVDPARARAAGHTAVYKGATYYFCSDICKKAFDANPAKYAAK